MKTLDEVFSSAHYEAESYLAKIILKPGIFLIKERGEIVFIERVMRTKDNPSRKKVKLRRSSSKGKTNSYWLPYQSVINELVRDRVLYCSNEKIASQCQQIENYRKLNFLLQCGITRSDFRMGYDYIHEHDTVIENIFSGKLDNYKSLRNHEKVLDAVFNSICKKMFHHFTKLTQHRTSSFTVVDIRNDKCESRLENCLDTLNVLLDYKFSNLSEETIQNVWSRFVSEVKKSGVEKYKHKSPISDYVSENTLASTDMENTLESLIF